MALAYSNIKVELREILLKDRPKELYELSSKGTVPVLVTIDGSIIDESLDIMIWALEHNKNQNWLNSNSKEQLNIIQINDSDFKYWLDRYKYHDQHPKNPKEYYREKCSEFLQIYEKKLMTFKYIDSNYITIVDIAIFPFIRQFANVDSNWFESQYKSLTKWIETISSSDLFKSIMKKYDVWDNESLPLIVEL